MALRFALASPHSTTVRLFDANNWITDVWSYYPDDIGNLVASAGDLFFFVDITEVGGEHRAQVVAWNPFTKDIKAILRSPSISRFPSLVRVQLFPPGGYTTTVTDVVVREEPAQNSFVSSNPPRLDYDFTMVGQCDTGATLEENYSSVSGAWTYRVCDNCVIREIPVAGLDPPGVVFRQTHNLGVGKLVSFGPRNFFSHGPPIPCTPPISYAPLDDMYHYVFLLHGRLPSVSFLQGERHEFRNAHQRVFKSPATELCRLDEHSTFVFGAKTGALVVQIHRNTVLPNAAYSLLYLVHGNSWHRLDGLSISRQELEESLLCQSA